jgi:hypothetical protein
MESAKSLRSVVISLVALLLFGISIARERHALRAALLEVEPRVIILNLLRVSPDRVKPSPKSYDDPVVEEFYERFRAKGVLYALGQTADAHHVERQVILPSGRLIYFGAGGRSDRLREEAVILVLEDDINDCANDPHREEPQAAIFAMKVDVHSNSDVVGKGFKFLVSNRELRPAGAHSTCKQPGRIFVAMLPLRGNQVEDTESLSTEVLRAAHSANVNAADPEQAYVDMRSRYEQARVKIPFIAIDVSAPEALLVLEGMAVAFLAWASFLLRVLAIGPVVSDEGWIVQQPLHRWVRTPWWRLLPATIEVIFFSALHVVAILTPAVLLYLVMKTSGGQVPPSALINSLLALSSVLTLSALLNYSILLRKIIIDARQKK